MRRSRVRSVRLLFAATAILAVGGAGLMPGAASATPDAKGDAIPSGTESIESALAQLYKPVTSKPVTSKQVTSKQVTSKQVTSKQVTSASLKVYELRTVSGSLFYTTDVAERERAIRDHNFTPTNKDVGSLLPKFDGDGGLAIHRLRLKGTSKYLVTAAESERKKLTGEETATTEDDDFIDQGILGWAYSTKQPHTQVVWRSTNGQRWELANSTETVMLLGYHEFDLDGPGWFLPHQPLTTPSRPNHSAPPPVVLPAVGRSGVVRVRHGST